MPKMPKIFKNFNKYIFICITIFSIFTEPALSQTDKCSSILEPKAYSDCSPYDSTQNQTVCCFIRGVYGGTNGTACLSVDELFKNKTVSLTINSMTSSMICGTTTSNAQFIQFNIVFFIFSLYLLMLI